MRSKLPLLRNVMPTDDFDFSMAINYLTRARNLRTQQNLTLVPSQTPRDRVEPTNGLLLPIFRISDNVNMSYACNPF